MRWLWLLGLAGCFYLDVINVAPVARIQRIGSGPVHPKDMLQLDATTSSDEDGDPLSYEWHASSPTSEVAFSASPALSFVVPSHDPVHITLTVADKYGARSEATLDVPITNQAPSASLVVTTLPNPDGSFTITRPIQFSASGQDPDGDALSYRFALHPPPQSDPNHVMTRVPSATSYEVTPDVPGRWEVEVTVDDGFGLTASTARAVTVAADAPPCIAATDPGWSPEARIILPRSAGPRWFSVQSVSDDLDAYPGQGIHFRWLVSAPGMPALGELEGHDLPDLLLDPADLDPGDTFAVRVEVDDRVGRTLPCGGEQAACSIGGNACLQRLTWTVEVR